MTMVDHARGLLSDAYYYYYYSVSTVQVGVSLGLLHAKERGGHKLDNFSLL